MMAPVHAALARSIAVLSVPLLATACGASPAPLAPRRAEAPPPRAAEAPLFGPARYVLVSGFGVLYDESASPAEGSRVEPALVEGSRVLLDHGLIVASGGIDEGLRGFQSIPARFGGGYLLWSRDRTFRADDFFGPLSLVAEVAASGGARPWLDAIWLRTERGIVAIEPGSSVPRDVAVAGIADGIALDSSRAVRVDTFGRASFTIDGGATFVDLLATRGFVTTGLLAEAAVIELLGASGHVDLELSEQGIAAPSVSRPAHEPAMLPAVPLGLPSLAERTGVTSSQSLASELLPAAVVSGLVASAGEVIVASEQGLRAFSLQTGAATAARDAPDLTRCQPFRADGGLAMACLGDGGGYVLGLDDDLAPGPTSAVFVEPGVFIEGGQGRFAFGGRCGPTRPAALDIVAAQTDREDEDRPGELPSDELAQVCVRLRGGAWVERSLEGDDARRLLRWIPADDGAVTALVLPRGPLEAGASMSRGDVRVIALDPSDPALQRGVFPAPPREESTPIDRDAWIDDQGDVRTWILLPDEEPDNDEETAEPREATAETLAGWPPRLLPVTPLLEGRFAGVTISPGGAVQVHALPTGTVSVVRGGRFALARAESEEGPDRTYESIDGGRTWRAIGAPPTGAVRGGSASEGVGCSEAGCAWGDGVVRLGWGESPPELATPPSSVAPSLAPPSRELALTCVVDALPARPPGRGSSLPSALVRARAAFGAVHAGDAEVTFEPDRGFVGLRRGERATQLFQLPHVAGVERFRLTLARGTEGPVIIGLSADSGRLFAGALELGRASVGPLEALGDVGSLTSSDAPACRALSAPWRFVSELRLAVDLRDRAGAPLLGTTISAVGRFAAEGLTLCLDGLEADLPLGGRSGRIELTATFDKGLSAELRDGPSVAQAACAIERAPAP